jgi:cytoplasmic iron level regulating protein YaaA (DUF328/UPF0246 family)
MLMVISPAKSLDFTAPDQVLPLTTPELKPQIAELAKVTRKLTAADLRRLMHISEKLADLNHQRFQPSTPRSRTACRRSSPSTATSMPA